MGLLTDAVTVEVGGEVGGVAVLDYLREAVELVVE